MNILNAASVFVLAAVLGGCVHPLQTSPRASVGDFTDQVLEPLALRVADEKIIEASAALRMEYASQGTVNTVANLLYEVPWIGKLLSLRNVSQKAHLEEDLAWLETRRLPLKRELLDLFVARTTQDGATFAFCVDGIQRRYQAVDTSRFTRLADGGGPCEMVSLYSLKKNQSPLRQLF